MPVCLQAILIIIMPISLRPDKPHADIHTNLNWQDTVPICLQTNPVTRLRADLPTKPTLRWHRTATYYRQTDRANTPTVYQPNNRACTPAIYRPNDCTCTPTINQLIDKLYAWPLSLRPLVLYYHPNRLLLLPPAAKLTPYCLPTTPQAQRKNCQWWNV